MKLGKFYILCTDEKKLKNNSIKFGWHYLKMETVFMNTENSKTSRSHRFKLDLTDKLNLKNPNKSMALANLSIYYTWKNVKSEYNNNKFKFQHQLGLMIYQMILAQFLTFKIVLNLSLKNMKLWPKIHQFKFIQIKSKIDLFSK